VKQIPVQLRAMSNKRMPTEPSYFISSVLRPIKQFFGIGTNDGPGSQLKQEFLNQYANGVFNTVTSR